MNGLDFTSLDGLGERIELYFETQIQFRQPTYATALQTKYLNTITQDEFFNAISQLPSVPKGQIFDAVVERMVDYLEFRIAAEDDENNSSAEAAYAEFFDYLLLEKQSGNLI